MGERGGQVLPDQVGADRQLAVPPVDEDRQPHGPGAAVVGQGVEGGSHRAAGVEDVVDEDHDLAVDAGTGDAGGLDGAGGLVAQVEGVDVPVGSLDVTMYRDDLSRNPLRASSPTQLPAGGIDGRTVVLVDDVLYSGRTIRAALDALSALGRPRAVRLAVLVDRGHRELPIRADYVGKNIPTSLVESVRVLLTEDDGRDAVLLGAAGESR